jgi:ABC-type uncharacterized transport system involved in gliding motility auxiliary subunit
MSRGALSILGVALAAVLALAVNVLAFNGLRSARLDLTQDKLYTLSDGSRRVLQGIEEPITLRFYFSQKLATQAPQISAYGQRVREMLEQFETVADGKIRLEVIDPEPFTEAEDDATRAGLQAVPLDSTTNLWFGLVGVNAVKDRETVPFFSQEKEQFLEYDLTRLVYNLSEPSKPVVGLITQQQMNADVSPMMQLSGRAPQPWAVVGFLRENFELKTIDPSSGEIPDDVKLLLIVHPASLPEKTLYAIDQFVLAGGKVVMYVDPLSEVAVAFRQQSMTPPSSNPKKLLAAWGVAMEEGKVVGDWQAAQQVNVGMSGAPKVMRYLPWLELRGDRINRDDVVTGGLGSITVASAGSLVKLDGATTEVTPLITTSKESALFDADQLRGVPDPQGLLQKFKPADHSFVIAARISGPAKTAFPDGPPKDEEKKGDEAAAAKPASASPKDPAKPHLAESKQPINVIVVADTDTLYDQFWVRTQELFGQRVMVPTASNADMALNALDNLSGSADLISLRSRGKSTRPFEVVDALRRDAEQQFLEQEQQLNDKLAETQKRIQELQGKAQAGNGALLTPEQEAEIESARDEVLKTRKELRSVQHELNKDIEKLEAEVKFANIGLVPLIVAVVALGLALVRRRRRRRRAEAG